MKKLAYLLVAGALIGLSSCGNNENTSTTEQIDSMATYRTDTMSAALRAQNDSLINAMAQMRADSAMRADSMAKVLNGKTITTTTTRTTTRPAGSTTSHSTGTPVKNVQTGGLGSQSDAGKIRDKRSVEGGGLGSQSDQKQSTNKKAVEAGGLGSQADKK